MKRMNSNRNSFFATGAGIVSLLLCTGGTLSGQQPVLSAATRSSLHRVSNAQLEAAPEVPEAPPAGQNTTAPMKDDLFAGTEKFAKGASDVTEVDMDPDSLNLVGGPEAGRAHRMVLNVVRTYTYDKPGMYNMADVEEFRHRLEGGDWHCSVHIRDLKNGDSTDVCSKHRAPDMIENAIITVSPKSLTFIHNIRKTNGQGGSLNPGGLPGLSMVPGLPLDLSMTIIQPEMQAEMIASAAAMRAEVPALIARTNAFRFDLPKMYGPDGRLKTFRFEMSPEQQRKREDLQKQLKNLPVLPQ